MKKTIIPHLLAILACGSLTAAPIIWGPATDVSTTVGNSSDVSTNGALIEAYNGVANDQIEAATTVTVNGVDFLPTTSLLNSDPRNAGTLDFSLNTNEGDAAYDALLSTVEFGGGTNLVTLTVGDGDGDSSITGPGLLGIGTSYEIQVWFVDTRNTRVTPVGDGNGNTVDLSDQFAIGTFTADAATQDITLASPGFGQAHITAYQIRNLAADPAPTVVLSTAAGPVNGAYTVDVTFSEDVNSLADSDFVVTNGIASGLLPASGPASLYTVTITPTTSGDVTVELPVGAAQDAGINDNLLSNTLTTLHVPAGSEQAMVTLSTTVADPTFDPYTVDVVFDEAVTDLDASDFDVVGGTASDVLPAAGPATNYTVTITPTVGGDIEVTLPSDSVLDTDDNLPNLTSNTLITEHIVPSIPSALLANPLGPIISGTFTVQLDFSEDVTGLDISDFVVTNGTASNLTPVPGSEMIFFDVDITPTATGIVTVFLPSAAVLDIDGENQTNTESNLLTANNLPIGTITSGLIDLSGRDGLGLGAGESNGFFENPKTFDSVSDLSLNDIAWTDGTNSGTFDLSFVANGSLGGIRRGGRGAFGTAAEATGVGLIGSGESVTLDSFTITDLQGDLAGLSANNIQLVAIYLGNATAGDGATINGQVAGGAPGGISNEAMRNDIDLASSATILGTGTGDGFALSAIDITFEVGPAPPEVVSCGLNDNNEFAVTFSGLDTETTYELRFSPDLVTEFTLVPGTTRMPAAATDTFIDPSPTLPGKGFYQLWIP